MFTSTLWTTVLTVLLSLDDPGLKCGAERLLIVYDEGSLFIRMKVQYKTY